MRSTILWTVSACALLTATGALAADAVVEEAPVFVEAPYFTWTGGYAGLQGGYASSNGELSDGIDFTSDNFDGGLFGAYAGYNWQSGSIVFGGEADINGVWNEKTFGTPGYNVEVGTDFLGSLRGSIGYAFDRALIFGTAGVAFTQISAEGTVAGIPFEGDETLTGWAIGTGVQYAFTDNWVGRAEYRFYDFDNNSIGAFDNIGVQNHTATVGVAYKF